MPSSPRASSMQKKAVKVVLTEQVWAKRRLWSLVIAAVLLAVAVAIAATCLLVYRNLATTDSDVRSGEDAGDVVVFRLNASESGLPEKIVLRPREWTTEFQTETMDVLHHFRKNVTLLHVKDDVRTPYSHQTATSFSTAAAAGGSLCFVAPADPADLRPDEMMKMLEEGRPLPKPEKVAYYDLAALTDDNLKDIAIDDQMVGFCGNSSVFTLRHIFDEEPREAPTSREGQVRSRRSLGDASNPFRLSVRPDGSADSKDGSAFRLPMCSAGNAASNVPSVTPCCQAKAFSCPPQIRYHCYLKLMNGVCDKLSCSGPQCLCPVKSMLVCVRLRGGPWSKKMCCARDQEPCNHRCIPELEDGKLSPVTSTASAAALSGVSPGRVVNLLPPEISVRVYPPPLPRVTLAELRARRLSVLHRILP